MNEIKREVRRERERCARIADGLVIAMIIGAGGKEYSVRERKLIEQHAAWIRDEIRKPARAAK